MQLRPIAAGFVVAQIGGAVVQGLGAEREAPLPIELLLPSRLDELEIRVLAFGQEELAEEPAESLLQLRGLAEELDRIDSAAQAWDRALTATPAGRVRAWQLAGDAWLTYGDLIDAAGNRVGERRAGDRARAEGLRRLRVAELIEVD